MDENDFGQQVQPVMTTDYLDPNKQVMTMLDWIITLVVYIIPCVGLIMYIVWAFGTGNENRKNYCRAVLIIALIGMVIGIICSAMFGAAIAAIISDMNGYY